mmetsp:Transcript_51575/g.131172  ORF Transcript_51575/g.131172 Transcript_51575/m.131172 type:complete len:204 (-) Transcript_51575:57-668(-)
MELLLLLLQNTRGQPQPGTSTLLHEARGRGAAAPPPGLATRLFRPARLALAFAQAPAASLVAEVDAGFAAPPGSFAPALLRVELTHATGQIAEYTAAVASAGVTTHAHEMPRQEVHIVAADFLAGNLALWALTTSSSSANLQEACTSDLALFHGALPRGGHGGGPDRRRGQGEDEQCGTGRRPHRLARKLHESKSEALPAIAR